MSSQARDEPFGSEPVESLKVERVERLKVVLLGRVGRSDVAIYHTKIASHSFTMTFKNKILSNASW